MTVNVDICRGRRSGKARRAAAAVSLERRARVRRLADGAAGAAAAGRADAGAATKILWTAAVSAGGGGRVRSLRRRATAAAFTSP